METTVVTRLSMDSLWNEERRWPKKVGRGRRARERY